MATSMLSAVTTPAKAGGQSRRHDQVEADLRRVLADSYTLMIKTQIVHWNVTGPMFVSVHELTEEQYNNLFEAVDDLAERLRALGRLAPSSVDEIVTAGATNGGLNDAKAEQMVSILAQDHRNLSACLSAAIETAEEASDAGTADLMTERVRFHDKSAWMLQALID